MWAQGITNKQKCFKINQSGLWWRRWKQGLREAWLAVCCLRLHLGFWFSQKSILQLFWRSQNTIMSCQILPLLCHSTIMWSQNTLKWFQTCDQLEWDLAAKCSNYQQLLIMKKNQVTFMIYSDVFTLVFMVCRVYRRIYQPIKVWKTCLPDAWKIIKLKEIVNKWSQYFRETSRVFRMPPAVLGWLPASDSSGDYKTFFILLTVLIWKQKEFWMSTFTFQLFPVKWLIC